MSIIHHRWFFQRRRTGNKEAGGRGTWKPTPVSPFSRFKLAHGLATELTVVRGPIVLSFPIWVARFLLGLADLVQVPLEFITWKQKYPAVSKWRLWHTMKKTRRKLYGWSASEVGVCFKWKYDGSVKLNANVLKCFNEPFSSVFLFFFFFYPRFWEFRNFFSSLPGERRVIWRNGNDKDEGGKYFFLVARSRSLRIENVMKRETLNCYPSLKSNYAWIRLVNRKIW